ncbi:hypothetical protein AURDEDRAFT_168834 [Auricularia subglabra TFB-10046 SS5]|nr:hypothetical protein AURDEDRAFT_168834 [Auricularia subglabra TFB-10046 SS5]
MRRTPHSDLQVRTSFLLLPSSQLVAAAAAGDLDIVHGALRRKHTASAAQRLPGLQLLRGRRAHASRRGALPFPVSPPPPTAAPGQETRCGSHDLSPSPELKDRGARV